MVWNNLKESLNEQVKKEFNSAYIYFAMSSYFAEIGLERISERAEIQALEKINNGLVILEQLNIANL